MPNTGAVSDSSPLNLSIFTGTLARLGTVSVNMDHGGLRIRSDGRVAFMKRGTVGDTAGVNVRLPHFIGTLNVNVGSNRAASVRRRMPALRASTQVGSVGFGLSVTNMGYNFDRNIFIVSKRANVVATARIRSSSHSAVRAVGTSESTLESTVRRTVCNTGTLTALCNLTPLNRCRVGFGFKSVACDCRRSGTT